METIVPVVLCGGSGTRLWPLSRTKTPKQFLKLMDENTLLQRTVLRAINTSGASEENVVTVTLAAMKAETTRQLSEISPHLTEHVLAEPEAKNTCAAVAYALYYVKKHFGEEAIVWILPADHHIGNEFELERAVQKALRLAREDRMVTFGIQPTRPETGYGYILRGKALSEESAFEVNSFVEKPDSATARKFVESGDYLWSSGMHVFKVRTAIANFREHANEDYMTVRQAIELGEGDRLPQKNIYAKVSERPFEKAVLEKAQRLAVVPCDPNWSDVGSFESLWEIKPKDMHGNAVSGRAHCHDTKGSLILAQSRLVSCIGLEDVVIVETGDTVLVASKNCGDSLKNAVKALQKQGSKETQSSPYIQHEWGQEVTLSESDQYAMREITVQPKKICNMVSDQAKHWVVAAGQAFFLSNGSQEARLREGDTLTLPAKTTYSLANPGTEPLRIFEFYYHADIRELGGFEKSMRGAGRMMQMPPPRTGESPRHLSA